MGLKKGNSQSFKIDNMDVEILKILLNDARENQRSIAKKCGITPVAVLRRIKKLEINGVIIGTSLLLNKEMFGNPFEVTVLIDVCNTLENEVKGRIRQIKNVVICAESIGRYNLCALIITHDKNELDQTISEIRKIQGVKSVNVNIWTGNRYRNFERDLKTGES